MAEHRRTDHGVASRNHNPGPWQWLTRGLLAAALLLAPWSARSADTATPAPAAAPAVKRPSVLFTGGGCGHSLAAQLKGAGFNLDSLPYPGIGGKGLTFEQAKRFNVLVVDGLGLANGDMTLNDKNKANIDTLRQFIEAGGGVFLIPVYGQQTSGIPPQRELLKPLGLEPLFEDIPRDPDNSVRATAWKIDFASTTNIVPGPLTQKVSSLWYPVATRAGAQDHTVTFTLSPDWSVAIKTMKSASTVVEPLEGLNSGRKPEDKLSGELPLLASRTVGKGRIVVFAVCPTYLFAEVGRTTLDGIVYDRGLRNLPSHGAVMVENAFRWLAEPSLTDAGFGGAPMNEKMLENPQKTKFGPPWDWAKTPPVAVANTLPVLPGTIGARTALSSGKGTVEEWVAQAKAAGLKWIVFLEEFAQLTPDEFAQLKKECARFTSREFAAIPGFTIDDEVGFHYFFFGTAFGYPDKKFLSADGKTLASHDAGLDPKNPFLKGQLAMTVLDYAYSVGGFRLTVGNYAFKPSGVPFANFFSDWDAMAVMTLDHGREIENAVAEYQKLAEVGQGPLPLVLDFRTDPAELAGLSWRTILRMPESGASAIGDHIDDTSKVAGYWDQWHFYPDNPSRLYISNGPEIVNWSFTGQRDYGGDNDGDFVWQNYRWLIHGTVRAAAGLQEVAVFDGEKPFRRFLPAGKNDFDFTLDLEHDKQHHYILIVTDSQGRKAISGEQWDRNHRLEEFNCSDRNNQLSYGWLTRRDGLGVLIGGNQTLATPNKRIGLGEISPSGTFKNDNLLGAPAFDGGAGGEPCFFATNMFSAGKAGEISAPPVGEAVRLLHTGDVNIGEGRYTHRFTDKIQVANVWHTLWRTEPAPDFTMVKRNHFFNIDPDSPFAVFYWQTHITLLRDLPAASLLTGTIRTGETTLWALRGSDGSVFSGTWDDLKRSDQRYLSVPFGLGAYAAALDSPLGGAAVFPMSEGMDASVSLPGRENTNLRFALPASRTPQSAGGTADVAFLIVGIPRAASTTRNLPTASTELVERFYRDFGLDGGKGRYTVTPTAGVVAGNRYMLQIDGRKEQAFSGVLEGKLISSLPIIVAGLNDRWSAVLYDRGLKKARPIGMFEGKAWTRVILQGKQDVFVGHPVTVDQAGLVVQVTQTGPTDWKVEVHNPTDKAVKAVIKANPLFEPLQGKTLPAEAVEVPAGQSVWF